MNLVIVLLCFSLKTILSYFSLTTNFRPLVAKDTTDDFEDVGLSSTSGAMLDEYYVGDIDSSAIPSKAPTTYMTPSRRSWTRTNHRPKFRVWEIHIAWVFVHFNFCGVRGLVLYFNFLVLIQGISLVSFYYILSYSWICHFLPFVVILSCTRWPNPQTMRCIFVTSWMWD